MPVLFSFGSFGDILAAADLAFRIAKALEASAGSTYEYQYLVQELHALAKVLRLINAATHTGLLRRDIRDALQDEIRHCRNVMDALWKRMKGYQSALGGGHSTGRTSRWWRKVGWALLKAEDVRETREKLSTHRLTLVSYMTACNLNSLEELKSQVTTFELSVHTRLEEICNAIRRLPQKIGYSLANGIIIQDWRGLETVLPPDLCGSKAQFLSTLHSVAFNWPPFVRTCIEHAAFVLTIENSKLLVMDYSCDDSYTSVLTPGCTARVGTFVTRSYETFGDCDESEAAIEPGFGICSIYCSQCLQNGKLRLYLQYIRATTDLQAVMHIGCDPEVAKWKVTVEESCDGEEMCRRNQIYTFHDPSCSMCSVSNHGAPAVHLPLVQDEHEPGVLIEYSNASFFVQHGQTFPYSVLL